MSEKYWTAEDLADHGYRLEQTPEDQAEQDDAYCITGADEPLSQRVNKRSREYIFKMSLRVVCIVCAVLVDGWMRWAFVAGSAVLPWAAGSLSPTNDPQDGLPHVAFTVPWNFAEHPAASLNWRHGADGVPVGVQVVGHRFDDLGVLRLSRTLEIMRPEQAGWPLG